jgi:hypothetical protein
MDIARIIRAGGYGTDKITELSILKKAKIAVVQDYLLKIKGDVPSQWKRAGEWKIPHVVTTTKDTISFFAVDADEAKRLIENLKLFSHELPKDVIQLGEYTK